MKTFKCKANLRWIELMKYWEYLDRYEESNGTLFSTRHWETLAV